MSNRAFYLRFMKQDELTHIDATGKANMVDVGQKQTGARSAIAEARVIVPKEIIALLENGEITAKKGPVFQTAILAGIMGAKKTSDLIPLCHPLMLDKINVFVSVENNEIIIRCEAALSAKTGVEMEALTGASVAALTIYDMCKALSHDIVISEIKLLEKKGGKNDFIRK